VANEGRLTVALDVSITEELRREGLARELVNRIQNLRKARNFEITDRIHILMEKNPAFAGTMEDWGEYISTQTLGLSLQQVEVLEDGTELDMDNMSLKIKVLKAE
jgi:isoleucyl-tRNA synthetase